MNARFILYIFTIISSILLPACNTHSQQVPPNNQTGGFGEVPLKDAAITLKYDTTSPQVQEIIGKLDKFYNIQAKAGFSGGVVIGYKGSILYERYYGFRNHEQKLPLNANASVQLASVTKTFTGAAILYLYQRKHIDIDKQVQAYLPTFPYPGITVRMLLDHRSGLPDYTHWVPNYIKNTRVPISNDEMLELMSIHKPHLEFKPNTRFTYSNSNYAILAKLVEVASGMGFREFMKDYIFLPLGMTHTFVYEPSKGLPLDAAQSYRYNWAREPDMFADGVYGDKGIYSTPEDMYKWDQSFYAYKLLNEETTNLAYGPCSFERPGVKNYGLGWRMLCYPNGDKIIYHNGWWHGNNTSFYRFIKDNFTIVVLGNRFNKSIYHHAATICGIINGVSNNKDMEEED